MKGPDIDARAFAQQWVTAWNAHDIDAVLGHYHPDATVTSPLAVERVPESFGTVRGHGALRAYWGPALGPGSEVHFELVDVLETVHGATILYRNQRGRLVAETVLWDDDGLVTTAVVAYGATP